MSAVDKSVVRLAPGLVFRLCSHRENGARRPFLRFHHPIAMFGFSSRRAWRAETLRVLPYLMSALSSVLVSIGRRRTLEIFCSQMLPRPRPRERATVYTSREGCCGWCWIVWALWWTLRKARKNNGVFRVFFCVVFLFFVLAPAKRSCVRASFSNVPSVERFVWTSGRY